MKKKHLQFITGLLSTITEAGKKIPADLPKDVRAPFDELNREVLLMSGRFGAMTPEDDAKPGDEAVEAMVKPMSEALELANRVIQQQETILLRMPTLVADGIKAGIEAKVTSGELVTKEAATSLATTARADGEKAAKAALELHSTRRQELVKCGLPAIENADVLGLEAAKFEEAKNEAKRRDGLIKPLKLPEGERLRLLFAKKEDFEAAKTNYETILANAGVKPNPMATDPSGEGEGKFAC